MKLTPPAPQNRKRRWDFFIKHPEYRGAKAALERIRREENYSGIRFENTLLGRTLGAMESVVKKAEQEKQPRINKLKKPSGVFSKKVKKASQRGV